MKHKIYTPEEKELIKKSLIASKSKGLADPQCAKVAGISLSELQRWTSEDPLFAEEFEKAAINATETMLNKHFEQGIQGDVRAQINWLSHDRNSPLKKDAPVVSDEEIDNLEKVMGILIEYGELLPVSESDKKYLRAEKVLGLEPVICPFCQNKIKYPLGDSPPNDSLTGEIWSKENK